MPFHFTKSNETKRFSSTSTSCRFTTAPIRPFARFSRLVAQNGGNSATQQNSKLACFRTGFVRCSPTMKLVTRERASIVTGIINGPSLFPLFDDRVTRREPVLSKKQYTLPPRFRAFLITSSLIDTSLPPYTPASLTLSPFLLLLSTYTHTHNTHTKTAACLVQPFVLPLFSTRLPPFLFLSRSLFSISLSPVFEKESNPLDGKNMNAHSVHPFDGGSPIWEEGAPPTSR